MPRKYDEATRAKAVRLVVEHRDEYPSEFAAITATAKRLKLTPETLRKWVRQSEVDAGEKPGVSRAEAAEVRALKRKVAELRTRSKSSRRQRLSSRGRATRATAADRYGLCVHRREQRPLRGRSDLPRALRARRADRPANVLRLGNARPVETGPVGCHDHRDPGRPLRA